MFSVDAGFTVGAAKVADAFVKPDMVRLLLVLLGGPLRLTEEKLCLSLDLYRLLLRSLAISHVLRDFCLVGVLDCLLQAANLGRCGTAGQGPAWAGA